MKQDKIINYIRNLIFRSLSVIIIFLSLAIICKSNKNYQDLIFTNLYEKNLSFAKIKKLYTKYLGGIEPLDKVVEKELSVFNENLEYENLSIYHDGIKLEVANNYLIPSLSEGMIIYIGEKDNYGNVIIIEDPDGIDYWYGNMENTAVKLYDYIEKGNYLGTPKDNNLYLVFKKDGKNLDYKEYLK